MSSEAIFRFPARCPFLATYPLRPLALIIGIFGIAVPVITAHICEEKTRVRSISYSWRQPYNMISLSVAFIQIVIVYFGFCASLEFFGFVLGGLLLAGIIIRWNPETTNTPQEEEAALVHQVSASMMFTYLLVCQIILFSYGNLSVNDPIFGFFILECILGVTMPISMLKTAYDWKSTDPQIRERFNEKRSKTWNWNDITSACEIGYAVLAIIIIAAVPEAEIVT